MRLKCLSFDRKLCQNVVFVVGDIFLHAYVGAPHLLAMLWFKSHQVKAPLWVFMAWSLPLALLGAAQARGWWLQSSSSASSALIMKPHSIRGPSSLCDCRNYHLPNWCEVPRARPAPPARTIRAGSPARGMLARSSSLPLCWNSGETSPGRAISPWRGLW